MEHVHTHTCVPPLLMYDVLPSADTLNRQPPDEEITPHHPTPYGVLGNLLGVSSYCWAHVSEPGFLKFQIFRFFILETFSFLIIFSESMLVRYRGINNKGALERPLTKCQFTGKC